MFYWFTKNKVNPKQVYDLLRANTVVPPIPVTPQSPITVPHLAIVNAYCVVCAGRIGTKYGLWDGRNDIPADLIQQINPITHSQQPTRQQQGKLEVRIFNWFLNTIFFLKILKTEKKIKIKELKNPSIIGCQQAAVGGAWKGWTRIVPVFRLFCLFFLFLSH